MSRMTATGSIRLPPTPGGRYQGVFLWADLDGTLLTPERVLPAENREAIAAFQAQGGRFGIATGRMERSASANFPDLVTNLPCIFYNGALVAWHPDGAPLRAIHLSHDPSAMLDAVMAACPEVGVEVLAAGKAWMVRRNAALEAQLGRERLEAVDARWSDIPPGWHKVLLGGEADVLASVARRLVEPAAGRFDLVRSEETLLEVLQPGVSKGEAARWIVGHAEPAPRCVAAVGDNDNDAALLAFAGVGVAMANGSASAKAAATDRIADNRTPCMPAVLAAIDAMLSRRGEGGWPACRA